ncbi:extracellular solute-binding protein [Brachybacterium sp. AOP25-B2-12]|uniref:extracellular solute-binding protein n=1 Tax=Brachybacterium sp. AOP25-B2-12 TaxID=3457710 RepID=UPI0040349489
MTTTRRTLLTSAALMGALGLAACAPGGSSSPAASTTLGPVSRDIGDEKTTLTVWDQNTDAGIDTAQEQLNAAFMAAHPNVTIERTSRSFSDLKSTLKLALSGDNPPHVIQANQGYPDMGAFVKAGFLRPVDDYAELYGWTSYFPESFLKLNSFSADGRTWQGDSLYGVSQTGELVGVYCNTALLGAAGIGELPTSLDELTAAMKAVHAAGTLPLAYGDVEKSPGIHLYGVVLTAAMGREAVNDLVTSSSGSWTDAAAVDAASTIAAWQDAGYITPGANGVSREEAVSTFGAGGAAFLITGTWYQATLEQAPAAADIRFTALTPEGASAPQTMGGEGLAWAITSKAEKPDVAAAYIDFITGAQSATALVQTGNLPTVVPEGDRPTTQIGTDITTSYSAISTADGISPYLDYATTTFYDTLTAGMQDLVAGQATPEQFCDALQKDYAAFQESR